MMLKLAGSSSLEKMQIVHIIIGGAICLFATFFLVDIAQNLLLQILVNLGFVGVMVYAQEFQIATEAFLFGLVYLIGGFLGGLYTGYQIYEKLRVILIVPALIGTIGFSLILIVFAGYAVDASFISITILQLLGNTVGSYLGGYALNWDVKTDETATGKYKIKLGS